MTLAGAVLRAVTDLQQAGLGADLARVDAGVLARHVLGWDAAEWLIRQREATTEAFQSAFDALIQRRRLREPVAYITGSREFYGRPFLVSREVLIPRPETELVVDEALKAIGCGEPSPSQWTAADVGTGSGCLAITLTLECPGINVIATDVSRPALEVAAGNARRLGADRRVAFEETTLLGDANHRFDLVVSNPPYVPERDRESLERDVRDYEPPLALFGGLDGLDVIRNLVPAAERGLVAGGWLVVEFGADQSYGVREILRSSRGLEEVRIVPDLAGIPRVLVARKREPSV